MAHITTQNQFDNSLFATIGGTEPVRVLTGQELANFIAANTTSGVADIGTPTLDGSMILTIPFTKDGNADSVTVDLSALAIDVQVASVTYDPNTNSIIITNSDSSSFSVPITDLIDTITNTLSSTGNTMTSNVNSVSSNATIINSLSLTKNGSGQLIVTVNGVSSSPVTILASNVAYTPSGDIAANNVADAIAELDTEKAPITSPNFSGTPLAPTASVGTNTTQIASTAFVHNEIEDELDKLSLVVGNPSQLAFISDTRNLNDSVGVPALGDFSRVFNPNSAGFDWGNLNGLSLYFIAGDYTGITSEFSWIANTVYANSAAFNKIRIDGESTVYGISVVNELTVAGLGYTQVSNIVTSLTIEEGSSANNIVIDIDTLSVDIDFSGVDIFGNFIFNIKKLASAVALKTVTGSILANSNITLNIEILDDILEIRDIDLSGIALNINIKQSTHNGRIRFNEGIVVSDYTRITIQGNFFQDGNETKNIGTRIIETSEFITNEGTLENRINIVNSTFKLYSSVAVADRVTDNIGYNIQNTSFIRTSTTAPVIELLVPFYLLNCITNEPVSSYDYNSDTNILGYIHQDVNFS